ncbi:hypothetical protein [Blastococcus sp. SYSU D01042]
MRRDPRAARVLGLWTAGWLAVLLVAGMVWLGEPSVQWPVLAVPLLWALVALRPRRRAAAQWSDDEWDGYPDDEHDDRWDDGWDDRARQERPRVPPGERTDTVERPALRRPEDDDPWERRRGR